MAPQGVTFLVLDQPLVDVFNQVWHSSGMLFAFSKPMVYIQNIEYDSSSLRVSYSSRGNLTPSNMYQHIFNLHTDILKALSHPKRLEIIHLLRDHSLSVGEIQEMLDLPQANLSQHLQVLRENKIVNTTKKGKQIFYRAAHPNFIKACDLIREVLQQKQCLSDLLPIGIDPICGMRLTPATAAFTHTADGQLHYFCASGCLEKYKSQLKKT